MQTLAKLIRLFICTVLVGSIGLILVYAIPTAVIYEHVKPAESIFSTQYTWERIIPGVETTRLDNYTAAIMLSEACYDSGEDPLRNAFSNYYYRPNNFDTDTSITPDKMLVEYLNEKKSGDPYRYSRYWHGYLVLLKPLLILFDYQGILLLNQLLQGLLAIALVTRCAQHGRSCVLAAICTLVFVSFFTTANVLQYSWVFYVAVGGSLIVLFHGNHFQTKRLWGCVFFLIGCITNYLDLLTYPLFTLCLPLLFSMQTFEESARRKVVHVFVCTAAWFVGFGIMWLSKWAISMIVIGNDPNLTERLMMRSSSTDNNGGLITYMDVLIRNITVYKNTFYAFALIATIALSIILSVKNSKGFSFHCITNAIPYLLIAVLPFIWAFATQNHMFIHFWMTYRIFAILPACFVLALATLFPQKNTPCSPE